jgi:hypothetical protein
MTTRQILEKHKSWSKEQKLGMILSHNAKWVIDERVAISSKDFDSLIADIFTFIEFEQKECEHPYAFIYSK